MGTAQRHFTQSSLHSTRHVCGMIVPFIENYKKSVQNKNLIEKEHAVHASIEQEKMPHILLPLLQQILLLGKDSFFLKDFFQDSLMLLLSLHPVSK